MTVKQIKIKTRNTWTRKPQEQVQPNGKGYNRTKIKRELKQLGKEDNYEL